MAGKDLERGEEARSVILLGGETKLLAPFEAYLKYLRKGKRTQTAFINAVVRGGGLG